MSSAMPMKTWEALVDPYFRFLRTEYHCVIADRSDKDWWSTRIVYQNTTTAAEVSYSVEFERVEVSCPRILAPDALVHWSRQTPSADHRGPLNLLLLLRM